jgi:antitoxin component of RelBE/YafQ-DinJ toxin-antitoxin module
MNNRIVTIRISDELYSEAKRFASAYGLSFSSLVKFLLIRELKDEKVEFVKLKDFDNIIE